MSKLDAKKGRWNADSETVRIFSGMRGFRGVWGDWLDYYRLMGMISTTSDVYDEAYGSSLSNVVDTTYGPQTKAGIEEFAGVETFQSGVGNWLVYDPPVRLPCTHVTHIRGQNENGEYGFYFNDDLQALVPYDLFTKSGMTYADIETGNYMRDRVVFDRWVFRVTQILMQGKIQERVILVTINCTQMKPDQLTDSPIFAQWSI